MSGKHGLAAKKTAHETINLLAAKYLIRAID
jgi:hypothetical protein